LNSTTSIASISSITLTPGIWIITANISYKCTSGSVNTITNIACSISTVNNTLDTVYTCLYNATNFTFYYPAGRTFLSGPCTRIAYLTANQTYYLVASIMGTGTLSTGSESTITALRIA
jgi:hypothetical protein